MKIFNLIEINIIKNIDSFKRGNKLKIIKEKDGCFGKKGDIIIFDSISSYKNKRIFSRSFSGVFIHFDQIKKIK